MNRIMENMEYLKQAEQARNEYEQLTIDFNILIGEILRKDWQVPVHWIGIQIMAKKLKKRWLDEKDKETK